MTHKTKHLYLLRHGESPTASGLRDLERPLSHTGKAQAQTISQLCLTEKYTPDLILCSEATRTRETLNAILPYWAFTPKIIYTPTLYHGSTGDYIALIQSVPGTPQRIMLIGHNPTIPATAQYLTSHTACTPHIERDLLSGYTPCTLSALSFPTLNSWKDIQPASASLRLHKPNT